MGLRFIQHQKNVVKISLYFEKNDYFCEAIHFPKFDHKLPNTKSLKRMQTCF